MMSTSAEIDLELEVHELRQALKEKEMQLSNKEILFENIIESTMAGYWDWDIPNNKEYLSPTFKSMFGYHDHELPNSPESWQKIIHPEDLPGVFDTFHKHVASKGSYPYDNEVRYFHKDGSIVWVYCRGKVIEWDENDQPVRMVGCHVNITSIKRAQQHVKESNNQLTEAVERFRLSCQSAMIGVWEWDLSNNKLEWDDTMYNLYGIKRDTFSSPSASWYATVHPEDSERVDVEVELAISALNDFNSEFRIIWPDESVHWIKANGQIKRDAKGNPISMVGINWDITAEKMAKEMDRFHMEQLRLKNEELQQFAYIASHDLQEPLRTITSMNDIIVQLYAEQLDDEAKKMMNFVSEAGLRMKKLIHGLLDYSRLGRNAEVELIDCAKLLDEVNQDLSAAICDRGALITHDNMPMIDGYKVELRLLLENLINNAMKFQNPGAIPTVHISCEHFASFWKFGVKDNGIGIDSRFKEKIFAIFQRLHAKNEYSGTGIGLSHCKKIAEMHDGRIWVESELGKGSTFYFTISKTIADAQNQ